MNERAIFDAAMEIDDPQRRSAYLNQVCGDNAELREHIEGLLEAHESLGSFLAEPAVGLVPGQARTIDAAEVLEQPGTISLANSLRS